MIYARYSSVNIILIQKNSYGNKIIDFNDIMPLCLERISVHSKKMRIGDDEEYKLWWFDYAIYYIIYDNKHISFLREWTLACRKSPRSFIHTED